MENMLIRQLNPKILWIGGIIIFAAFIKLSDYYFDFDQKIVDYSNDIHESKKNRVFARTIKLDSVVFRSSRPPLKITSFNGWIEKASIYYGHKIKHVDPNSYMVIFDFKLDKDLDLNEKNYVNTWDLYHDKNYSVGGLFSGSNIRGNFRIDKDAIDKPIELEIVKYPLKNHSNNSQRIGYLRMK